MLYLFVFKLVIVFAGHFCIPRLLMMFLDLYGFGFLWLTYYLLFIFCVLVFSNIQHFVLTILLKILNIVIFQNESFKMTIYLRFNIFCLTGRGHCRNGNDNLHGGMDNSRASEASKYIKQSWTRTNQSCWVKQQSRRVSFARIDLFECSDQGDASLTPSGALPHTPLSEPVHHHWWLRNTPRHKNFCQHLGYTQRP